MKSASRLRPVIAVTPTRFSSSVCATLRRASVTLAVSSFSSCSLCERTASICSMPMLLSTSSRQASSLPASRSFSVASSSESLASADFSTWAMSASVRASSA